MTKEELIERLKKLVFKYKDEAEYGSILASTTYSIVADDLESLIKEAEDESNVS